MTNMEERWTWQQGHRFSVSNITSKDKITSVTRQCTCNNKQLLWLPGIFHGGFFPWKILGKKKMSYVTGSLSQCVTLRFVIDIWNGFAFP